MEYTVEGSNFDGQGINLICQTSNTDNTKIATCGDGVIIGYDGRHGVIGYDGSFVIGKDDWCKKDEFIVIDPVEQKLQALHQRIDEVVDLVMMLKQDLETLKTKGENGVDDLWANQKKENENVEKAYAMLLQNNFGNRR